MSDNVIPMKERAAWRRSQRIALKQDLADLEGQLASMAMLLHAIIQRHGKQVFSLEAIETCDPKGVHVDVDYKTGRVEVRLTPDAEK